MGFYSTTKKKMQVPLASLWKIIKYAACQKFGKKMKKIHDTAPSTFFYNEKMRMLCKDYCGSGLTCLGYNTCLQIRKGFLMLLNNINIYIYEIINQWKMSEWKKNTSTNTLRWKKSPVFSLKVCKGINPQSKAAHHLKIN